MTGQTHPLQGDGLGLKGGGIENLGACLGIGPLQCGQLFRICQNPFLGAAALGHAGFLEVGAGGAVQKTDTGSDFFVKLFFGEHMDYLVLLNNRIILHW